MAAASTKALEIAESLDDAEFQLRSLWGLWSFHMRGGRHRVALAQARRFCSLAANRPDPSHRLVGERLIGMSQHFMGDQPSARRQLEHMLAHYVPPVRKPDITRFHFDQRVTARAILARVLWLQGFPDQAMRAAETSIEEARAANHAMSLCYTLAYAACPIALLIGDLTAAEHYIGMLLDHSTRHALVRWRCFGRCYEGVLVGKRGDTATGLRLLSAWFDEFNEAKFTPLRLIPFPIAEALACAGQVSEGLAAVNEAMNHSEHTEELGRMAELLRVKGELLLLQGPNTALSPVRDRGSADSPLEETGF